MRTIEDLEHFVLQPGEVLILRSKRHLSPDEVQRMRERINSVLPGRPVLVLSPDFEVCAGMIEVFGADPGAGDEMLHDDQQAIRDGIEDAYNAGAHVFVKDPKDGWFYVHRNANPHTFDWDNYEYSLTAPSPFK